MFNSEELKNHFESSTTIRSKSIVLAEWNMNSPENILMLGNYRYRKVGTGVEELRYNTLTSTFDINDNGYYYLNADKSRIEIFNGYTYDIENEVIPSSLVAFKDNMQLFYSLEDCIKPFRPRSGINKLLYFNNKYLPNVDKNIATRPRYYMPSRDDIFKYWTSYRVENNVDRGISYNPVNGISYIDDAVPFVVYQNPVPANRIVVKMQTGVGSTTNGSFSNGSSIIDDPFYGESQKSTPVRWKIQYLKNNNWIDAISFNETSIREDDLPIIGNDGNVEIAYGLVTPEQFANSFVLVDQVASEHILPENNINGYGYLVVSEENSLGKLYVWNELTKEYLQFTPEYKWFLSDSEINPNTTFVTDLTSPKSFLNTIEADTEYREFCYISGIRVVVESMNKPESTFDLIEMSPRLLVDLSHKVVDFNIKKSLSDLGITSLPVGQLLVSTGNLNIFDDDQAFNENNTNSIISNYLKKNIKFLFYESVYGVNDYNNYTIALKTLYSEGFPQGEYFVSIALRDLFFLFESIQAPELLITEASLSYAVSILLDSVGFTNYSFYRVDGETDPIIPYFFVSPGKSVAEVLNELARSTQYAMYFDEYNNFIVMSKNYLMPSIDQRPTDFMLVGSKTHFEDGLIENKLASNQILPNIINISSVDKKIYNNGRINYTERYIQRQAKNIQQAYSLDSDIQWAYKPSLLWEVSGDQATKTINEKASNTGNYVLSAMPLNSNIPNTVPTVVNRSLINNTIDVGENIYWTTRYQGYFYSHGEIIKYDAVEFDITGTGKVWISNNQEYQNYFSALPFNGKIYPTGLIRIFASPYYENVDGIDRMKNGEVFAHGRGQFGTKITTHNAGIDPYWVDNKNVRGCYMQSEYLFNINESTELPEVSNLNLAAGVNNELAKGSTRNSIIKNFLANSNITETDVNSLQSTQTGTVQASAFVFNGPSFKTTEKPLNMVSYAYKGLSSVYKHFGTRMRIIGKLQDSEKQTALGSVPYYQIPGGADAQQNISIAGGSGGIAFGIDEKTNNGYYFEIIALTEGNIESYSNTSSAINNVVFYKIQKDASNSNAIPIKLYGGLTKIVVDDGSFVGQQRVIGEENSTVYDLSVEYQDIDKIRRFYLYINNQLISVVDDDNPLKMFNNVALFVRGSSKCIFENIYALDQNYSQNSVFTVGEPLSNAFGTNKISANNAFSKYSISGLIQSTYLSGISTQTTPAYSLYYDEFGSIMRECAYFNIKYDKAYPALYAQLAPTFNKLKGYTVSGFLAGAYGAEFLIFNNTDTALNFDESSGNYLKINGITFTQDTNHEYTVDQYFSKRSNLSDPKISGTTVLQSPVLELKKYNDIKLSRISYGVNEFSIDGEYIQTQDQAEELMSWIINKVVYPKKSIGVEVFSNPMIQLGDIVSIDYKDNDGLDIVTSDESRFVVYNIEYERNDSGPKMSLYLSEV